MERALPADAPAGSSPGPIRWTVHPSPRPAVRSVSPRSARGWRVSHLNRLGKRGAYGSAGWGPGAAPSAAPPAPHYPSGCRGTGVRGCCGCWAAWPRWPLIALGAAAGWWPVHSSPAWRAGPRRVRPCRRRVALPPPRWSRRPAGASRSARRPPAGPRSGHGADGRGAGRAAPHASVAIAAACWSRSSRALARPVAARLGRGPEALAHGAESGWGGGGPLSPDIQTNSAHNKVELEPKACQPRRPMA